MNRRSLLQLGVALALLAFAGWRVARWWQAGRTGTGQAFFYDLSEKKLFAGPRDAVPPIRGLNDDQTDAVRAVVVSTNGRPADRRTWRIAYLEMYSPELKRQMEAAQAGGPSPAMGRAAAQQHRYVRRLADPDWHPLDTPEGERIVTEWATPGADGLTPVVCQP